MNKKNEKTEQKNRLISLVRSVVEFLHRISEEQFARASRACPERSRRDRQGADIMNPNHESRVPNPDPVALSHEQFRRMLEETLAADPHFLRRCLQPLAGTAFPIVGGMPAGPLHAEQDP